MPSTKCTATCHVPPVWQPWKVDIPYIRPTRLFFLPLPLSILLWHETTYCSSGALRQQSSAPCPIPSQCVPIHNPTTQAQVDHISPRDPSHRTPPPLTCCGATYAHTFDLNSDLTGNQNDTTRRLLGAEPTRAQSGSVACSFSSLLHTSCLPGLPCACHEHFAPPSARKLPNQCSTTGCILPFTLSTTSPVCDSPRGQSPRLAFSAPT